MDKLIYLDASNQIELSPLGISVLAIIMLWSFVWKSIALWRAASKKQITWFMIFLVFNTLGILEIGYLFILQRYELGSPKLLKFIKANFGHWQRWS